LLEINKLFFISRRGVQPSPMRAANRQTMIGGNIQVLNRYDYNILYENLDLNLRAAVRYIAGKIL